MSQHSVGLVSQGVVPFPFVYVLVTADLFFAGVFLSSCLVAASPSSSCCRSGAELSFFDQIYFWPAMTSSSSGCRSGAELSFSEIAGGFDRRPPETRQTP
ncbi:hypothetical protein P8452_53226 [Trifolium repens]|nr:hypothetical protein P8452_53226 [Trifolium repens]